MTTQGPLNQKLPLFVEIMEAAQKLENPIEYLMKAIKADVRLTAILGFCVNPRFKLPLPEGVPPYLPSDVPMGLAEIELLHQHKLLMNLFDLNIKAHKKEEMFVKWLERMCEKEAAIMVAIKDQNLHSLYSKITEEVIVSALGWDKALFAKIKSEMKK